MTAAAKDTRPVPTPCRDGPGKDDVPDILDISIPKPKPGVLRVSSEAVEGRLRRIFTPNIKGEFKVSAEIVSQWKTKKGKRSLQQLFQSVGYSTDWFGKLLNFLKWNKPFMCTQWLLTFWFI